MNPIQKAYESIDRTTIMLKRNQSYCHLRNLYQIRDKKTQVRLFNPKKPEHSKPTEFDIFKAKKIENDNEILRKKLIHLFCKSPKSFSSSKMGRELQKKQVYNSVLN